MADSEKDMQRSIFSSFDIPGHLVGCEPFGSGLINDTWLCTAVQSGIEHRYIIQRINTSVFPSPVHVMENIETVTAHIASRLREKGASDPFTITPCLVPARSGLSYFIDGEGGFWRAFHFIESCVAYERVTEPWLAREVGVALGRFHALVSDLRPQMLHDTLPWFHHTPRYLKEFDDVAKDGCGSAGGLRAEIAFVNERRNIVSLLIDAMDSGAISVRVVHNDPKVSNVLINTVTRKAISLIDLDTVKPGIIHFDFGDCARSVANPAGEDPKDFGDVRFDLRLFRELAAGYLEEAGGFLTKNEIHLLPASVKVITFELGLRFLTDHLKGDTYFKVGYPGQNLQRARAQFRLLEQIERAEEDIAAIIHDSIQSG